MPGALHQGLGRRAWHRAGNVRARSTGEAEEALLLSQRAPKRRKRGRYKCSICKRADHTKRRHAAVMAAEAAAVAQHSDKEAGDDADVPIDAEDGQEDDAHANTPPVDANSPVEGQ